MDADFWKQNDIWRRQHINTRIYETGRVSLFPSDRHSDRERAEFDVRLREVYGAQYEVLVTSRVNFDLRVAELLIQEAIRIGEWKVLPESLQAEYHKRVQNMKQEVLL